MHPGGVRIVLLFFYSCSAPLNLMSVFSFLLLVGIPSTSLPCRSVIALTPCSRNTSFVNADLAHFVLRLDVSIAAGVLHPDIDRISSLVTTQSEIPCASPA